MISDFARIALALFAIIWSFLAHATIKASQLLDAHNQDSLRVLAEKFPKKQAKLARLADNLADYSLRLFVAKGFLYLLGVVLVASLAASYVGFNVWWVLVITLVETYYFVWQDGRAQALISEQFKNYVGFAYYLGLLFAPLTWLVELLLPKIKVPVESKTNSWKEIVHQIELGHNSGELDNDEFEMIDGVISMHEKMAKEVMVPRIDAFMIDITNDNERSIDNIIEMNYSRVPVYHEDKDNIVGVIHIKKLLKAARRYGFDHITIRQVMQPAFFVPETIMIDELLFQMKKSQNQLAILLDEYGGVVGLVTLEDLLEEIVGEIEDETDEPTETVKQLSETEFLIDGKMPVDDFNDEFAAHLETTTADTIAGYVIEQLGFFPEEGQVLNVRTPEGIILETHQVIDGTRIAEIKLRLPQQLAKLYDKRILEQAKLDEKLGN